MDGFSSGDLALLLSRNNGFGCGYDGGCYHRGYGYGRGAVDTGIGLGAASLGAIVIGGIAAVFGLNAASKARARAAENKADGNSKAIEILAGQAVAERQSRENWQNQHAPTLTQYVDVRTQSGASALANAEALAYAQAINNNSGLNSAIGGCNFLRVARYSAPRPCGCDGNSDI